MDTVMMWKTILLVFSVLLASSALADRPHDISSQRIVGGTPTSVQWFPYMVATLLNPWGAGGFNQACGGTILTTRHILSAAHCYQDNFAQPQFWMVRAGSSFRSSGGTLASVSRIINHPQYGHGSTFNNDVSVLVLLTGLPLSATIAQGSIPVQGFNAADNAVAYAIGWGLTSFGGSPSEQLLHISIRTVNQQTCIQRYGSAITNAMMCAGLLGVSGVGVCQGDSGGPLIHDNMVIGITSWGVGCADGHWPGVYARVSYFTNWIVNTVNTSW